MDLVKNKYGETMYPINGVYVPWWIFNLIKKNGISSIPDHERITVNYIVENFGLVVEIQENYYNEPGPYGITRLVKSRTAYLKSGTLTVSEEGRS